MELNLLAFAIPIFLLLMVSEYLIAKGRRFSVHSKAATIANVSIGLAERLSDFFVAPLFFQLYKYIHEQYALFDIRPNVGWWILLLLFTDFIWYWYHRLAHEVNLFWAVHVVHHQSEEFNYTVSARITVLQAFVRFGFWSILPVSGFPAEMIVALLLIHGAYPFFTHTQLVGRLGVLEYLLVTPSHHRVHHASNEQYLDKNYGDVFIIWDKLFGTFAKEGEAPTYGLTKPLHSYSFLWQHFHFFVELWVATKKERSFLGRCRLLFGSPGRFSASHRQHAEELVGIRQRRQFVPASSQLMSRYVIWQLGFTMLAVFGLLLFETQIGMREAFLWSAIILVSLINIGAILEQRQWIFYLEFVRGLFMLVLVLPYLAFGWVLVPLAGAAGWLFWRFEQTERRYLQLVYQQHRTRE